MSGPAALIAQASEEIGAAAAGVDAGGFERLVGALAAARRIAVAGVGREGLMMRALAMRLFHLGLDAHVVGDMTTPPLGNGDLLVVSAGPGDFATIRALVTVARDAGADAACLTAQPTGAVPALCDPVLTIPAQTMADDTKASASGVLPMGSVFEGAQFLVCEALVITLRDRCGVTAQAMRGNHTNLE